MRLRNAEGGSMNAASLTETLNILSDAGTRAAIAEARRA